jgi:hypothetical protein
VPLRELQENGTGLTRPDLESGILQFRFYASFGVNERAGRGDVVLCS